MERGETAQRVLTKGSSTGARATHSTLQIFINIITNGVKGSRANFIGTMASGESGNASWKTHRPMKNQKEWHAGLYSNSVAGQSRPRQGMSQPACQTKGSGMAEKPAKPHFLITWSEQGRRHVTDGKNLKSSHPYTEWEEWRSAVKSSLSPSQPVIKGEIPSCDHKGMIPRWTVYHSSGQMTGLQPIQATDATSK